METEIVLVPTYRRPEMLFYCLSLIHHADPHIEIAVFPDRGTFHDKELDDSADAFDAQFIYVGDHHYHGNTYNVMEAFRWAYNQGYQRIYLVEDDVMVHWDFFKWHREVHEDCPKIFASMGWVFNREAPITADCLFQPWYYSIGTCFKREKLELIVKHASPLYYEDMASYIGRNFKRSAIHDPDNVVHYEQDGLIQRILDEDKTQTVACGMAKCTHLGTYGYNQGWEKRDAFFEGCGNLPDRLQRISDFLSDPYARAEIFGRALVEREIGKALPKREFRYQLKVGEFEAEYVTETSFKNLPKRLLSVPRTPEMQIVVSSTGI